MTFNATQKKLMWVGTGLVLLALIIFGSNAPSGPSQDLIKQANSNSFLSGGAAISVEMKKSAQQAYQSCLVGSSYFGNRCPMGGNLYLLFLGGVALFGVGMIFKFGKSDDQVE
ncbi:MAG: hypothetical protein AAF429_06415 [Pseudomonadota bacterium]